MSATKTEKMHERVVQRRALHRSSGTLFVDPPQKIRKKKKKKKRPPAPPEKTKKKPPAPPEKTKKKKPSAPPEKKKTPPAPLTFDDILKKMHEEGKKMGIDNRKGITGDKIMKKIRKLKF